MKNSLYFWQKFEKSGALADYMEYCKARAEDLIKGPADDAPGSRGSIEGVTKLP